MRALLDVNVLIALLDAGHVHHVNAQNWMLQNLQDGWASCPITQNGCIRIMAQPSYPGSPFPMAEVAKRLTQASQNNHSFWPDDLNTLHTDRLLWNHLLGHRQLTDAYLLALAVQNQGRFVSFDLGVDLACVRGAKPANYARIL